MARGGKRAGAGRPPGPQISIRDYWDKDAIAEYFEYLRDNYKEDSRLMVFVGEQLMGKARQSLEVENPDGSLKTVIIQKIYGDSDNKASPKAN